MIRAKYLFWISLFIIDIHLGHSQQHIQGQDKLDIYNKIYVSNESEGEINIYKSKNTSISDAEPAEWFIEYSLPLDVSEGDSLKIITGKSHIKHYIGFLGINSACSELEVAKSFKETNFEFPAAGITELGILRFNRSMLKGERVRFSITAKLFKIANAEYLIKVIIAGIEQQLLLSNSPGIAESFAVIAKPAATRNGVKVLIQPLDRWKWSTTLEKPVNARLLADKRMVWEGLLISNTSLYVKLEPKQLSVSRLDLQIQKSPLTEWVKVAESNPIWLEDEDIPMFGALHWHSELSPDGIQPIEKGFAFGKDELNLDFIAPADHTPKGDKWAVLTSVVDKFNGLDEMVTLFGWEWSTKIGHVNFYFTQTDHLGNPDKLTEYVTAKNLGKTANQFIGKLPFHNKDIVAIPHHTNAKSYQTEGWEAYKWTELAPEYLRLLEIFQSRGNMEREHYPDNNLWRVEFTNNGGSYQTGLDKGHHLGVVAGTDNHSSYPGRIQWHSQGKYPNDEYFFTGVWAKERSRKGVLNGLYERSTWACWGTRAIVRYKINGVLQGGELEVSKEDHLIATIRISAEEPLKLLELVTSKDKSIPLKFNDKDRDINLKIDLGKAGDAPYYYLRAILKNGAIIYASPVFLNHK
jgi:hypothetical protein